MRVCMARWIAGACVLLASASTVSAQTIEPLEWVDALKRLLLTAALTTAVGIEREWVNHGYSVKGLAGLRTHVLVGVASCTIQLLSVYGYAEVPGVSARRDPARLAAQAVNGIGFLGAGAIWNTQTNMRRGLTTAATLWFSMAIGLGCGVGYDVQTVFATLLALVTLLGFRKMRQLVYGKFEDVQTVTSSLFCEVLDTPGSPPTAPVIVRVLLELVRRRYGVVLGIQYQRSRVMLTELASPRHQHHQPSKSSGGDGLPPTPAAPKEWLPVASGASEVAIDLKSAPAVDPLERELSVVTIGLIMDPDVLAPALLEVLQRYPSIHYLVCVSDKEKDDFKPGDGKGAKRSKAAEAGLKVVPPQAGGNKGVAPSSSDAATGDSVFVSKRGGLSSDVQLTGVDRQLSQKIRRQIDKESSFAE